MIADYNTMPHMFWNQGDRFLDEFGEFIQKPVPLILRKFILHTY